MNVRINYGPGTFIELNHTEPGVLDFYAKSRMYGEFTMAIGPNQAQLLVDGLRRFIKEAKGEK